MRTARFQMSSSTPKSTYAAGLCDVFLGQIRHEKVAAHRVKAALETVGSGRAWHCGVPRPYKAAAAAPIAFWVPRRC